MIRSTPSGTLRIRLTVSAPMLAHCDVLKVPERLLAPVPAPSSKPSGAPVPLSCDGSPAPDASCPRSPPPGVRAPPLFRRCRPHSGANALLSRPSEQANRPCLDNTATRTPGGLFPGTPGRWSRLWSSPVVQGYGDTSDRIRSQGCGYGTPHQLLPRLRAAGPMNRIKLPFGSRSSSVSGPAHSRRRVLVYGSAYSGEAPSGLRRKTQ